MRQIDAPPLEHTLQVMIEKIGPILEVDLCILRGFDAIELANRCWIWRSSTYKDVTDKLLEQTVPKTDTVISLSKAKEDQQVGDKSPTPVKICSTLLIPLILQQEIIAVLGLHQGRFSRNWLNKDLQLGMMVADQIILALINHRAYEQVSAFAQRELLINTITVAIRSSLDSQTIFRTITHQLGQALKVDGCALSLWTKDDVFVECVGLYDRHEFEQQRSPYSRKPLPQSIVPIVDNPVLQKLLKTGKPVVLEDLELDPDLNKYDLPLRSPAKALLVVPLIVDEQIIGSISLRQTEVARKWSSNEIDLALAVAAQAAIATNQARLYETTKQQAEQLRQSEQRVTQLNQYLTESVLKRFLPPSIVNRVAAGELLLDLSPENRLVTILFSDIVGFTPLSSQLGSDSVAILLNEYLEMMTQAVFEYGGTVDKFIGDAIFALFGAPEFLEAKEQVRRAIAVARKMHYFLKQLNQRWQEQGLLGGINRPPLVQFRCGIHQGQAVVGMFGGGQRSDYTAIGSTVNMAARLQKEAEANTIIVSETVANYLEKTDINQVRYLALKGIPQQVLAFSINI